MSSGTSAERAVFVESGALQRFATAVFRGVEMRLSDARYCARCLVQANLWGVDSHGVLRLPIYVERLRNGALNPRAKPQIVRGGAGLEVMDGDRGMGFIAGRDAMQRAIRLAERLNLGAVGVTNSNHFGAAGIYARLAADRGMIGIAMSNVVPKVVAPGGTRPITGNNPIAVAVPTYGEFPFVLDMSLSAVAGGRLLLAAKRGDKIPTDWATDADGRPTDDPTKAFAGFYLPMGGLKGLGLSYVVDILCGLVTGDIFGAGVKSMYDRPTEPSETGHMMMAVNVAAILDADEMKQRMATFFSTVKSSPLWDRSTEMLVPGERAYRTSVERRAVGIPLPPSLHEELLALGAGLGVTDGLPPKETASRQTQARR